MQLNEIIYFSQWIFLFYFVVMNVSYLGLNASAFYYIYRYMAEQSVQSLPDLIPDVLPPISILVPAHNEETSISASIHALLQLDYPEFEIIVVNDGSVDATLQQLIGDFSLKIFPEAYRTRIQTSQIHAVYRSTRHQSIRVVDKGNGGKADSLNAGINIARYPLVCSVDADSVLQQDSLRRIVQPFVLDNRTVASGGTVRIVNGCEVEDGFISKVGMPRKILPMIQVVEYLRAFLFGRIGWSPFNALLIISGAFGLFHKETVVAIGGYRTDTIGEDMELIVRMHRKLCQQHRDYRITFVPDPICWTEAPTDLGSLARQRVRWQRGLSESLFKNFPLLFRYNGGMVAWGAMPFMMLFEWFGPVIEVLGYIVIIIGYSKGIIPADTFFMLIGVAISLGMLLSVTALLLEEISFHVYKNPFDLLRLFLAVVAENIGYRQLTTIWRLWGIILWLVGSKANWGKIHRNNS